MQLKLNQVGMKCNYCRRKPSPPHVISKKNTGIIGLGLIVAVFATLMVITVVNEVTSTFKALNNEQTSINLESLEEDDPFDETTVALILDFGDASEPLDTITAFFDNCACSRQYIRTDNPVDSNSTCETKLWVEDINGTVIPDAPKVLFIKNAQYWGYGESLRLVCNHSHLTQAAVLSTIVQHREMKDIIQLVDHGTPDEREQQVLNFLIHHVPQLLSAHASNQVLSFMERTKTSNDQNDDQVSITSQITDTYTGNFNVTEVDYKWGAGEIKEFKKFQSETFWSLITLAATVFLAMERLYAFIQKVMIKWKASRVADSSQKT